MHKSDLEMNLAVGSFGKSTHLAARLKVQHPTSNIQRSSKSQVQVSSVFAAIVVGVAILAFTGCATYKRSGLPPAKVKIVEQQFHLPSLSPEEEDKILALDPLHVSGRDIREVLSHAPAPRLINIHGGIYP